MSRNGFKTGLPRLFGRRAMFTSSLLLISSMSTIPQLHDHQPEQRKLLAGLVAGSVVFGSISLMAPFVFSRSQLPFMGTPARKIKHALKHTYALHSSRRRACGTKTSPSLIFVDLGSGDGEAVRLAAQVGYTEAIGIELNYTLYLLSQLRRILFWSSHERRHSKFFCRDFFQYDIKRADTVMIFGIQPLMEPLSRKLATECQPGATVLSYRFVLPVLNRLRNGEGPPLLDAEVIYEKEEMRIYEVVDT